jgi:hypothetical protein
MKYRYSKTHGIDLDEKPFFMPLVPTTAFGPKGAERTYFALSDSGAAYSMASMEVANSLGIQLDKTKSISTYGVLGVDHTKPAYLVPLRIKLQLIRREVTIPFYFLESNAFAPILGQRGFFDQHRIRFEKHRNVFDVVPVMNS